MADEQTVFASRVRLNIGGKHFETTIETLTQRDSDWMLGVMFSGRHQVHLEPDNKNSVFVDRDGKHFRYILNFLRDGSVPHFSAHDAFSSSLFVELMREAEYYQIRGLIQALEESFERSSRKGEEEDAYPELTRKEVIIALQSSKGRFRGVNLSGENLSKLDLSNVDFSFSRLLSTCFFQCHLQNAVFRECNAETCNFGNAFLKLCDFEKANLKGSSLDGCTLSSANLQDACLEGASLCGADLKSAHLQNADLRNSNLSNANLEGANLKGAKLTGANLTGANLQRAYLRDVNLRDTILVGATLQGANLQGANRV